MPAPSRAGSGFRNGSKTFGLTSGSNTKSRGTFRRRGGGPSRSDTSRSNDSTSNAQAGSSSGNGYMGQPSSSRNTKFDDRLSPEERFKQTAIRDDIDAKIGFERLEAGPSRQAWLVNMHPTLIPPNPSDEGGGHPSGKSAVDFYFIEDDASSFKVTVQYSPYILLGCRTGTESLVEEWLKRKFEGTILSIERQRMEDLKLPNHLVGQNRILLKISFWNIYDLLTVRRELLPLAERYQKRRDAVDTYADTLADAAQAGASAPIDVEMEHAEVEALGFTSQDHDESWNPAKAAAKAGKGKGGGTKHDPEDCIADLREYDVPYYLRVAIDNDIRVGMWYSIAFDSGVISIEGVPSRVKRAEPTVLAFDIETTKQPLKFPDAETDVIMMISYMIDGQGFLITNREIVSEDIDDFEYSPKEEYEGPFIIFNEPNELALIQRFFSHFREARPTVVATYNGDSFDFPFVDARATAHGLDIFDEIGFTKDNEGEYKSRTTAHMDCFRWVKRDSYLPQGSQGLKAVTVAKLGYDPMELDPELMTPYAMEQPQTLAQYSVSDAVATYYLYMKYVHPFIFSLCNIIPLNPDEVLRKGSGTLCETLLMVQAYKAHIVMPNRHNDPVGSTYEGHLLESETYVGGHVEALEAGVFRSDIATDFKLDPAALQQLIDDLDAALQFSIKEEGKMSLDDIENYDEVKAQIQAMLEHLRDDPLRKDTPLIYHLDVAAMYPNIMLSNRLQPDSVVDEAMCATCDFNRPGMKCDKKMTWAWRGEYFPAKRDEVNMIRHALSGESFPPRWPDGPRRTYHDLSEAERSALLHKRLGDYSRKVYRKTHETKTVIRESTICQRENPFYIDTVRDFRDRRYEYKGLHKTWKKNLDKASSSGSLTEVIEAKKMIVLYDSLQLAHKCILNSFYGYVMRKGARWYSMEMAGITCLTGASIIQMAKELVDRIGRPLELDTDGIWCMLPGKFPENFNFKCKGGKKFGISYPCTMLNHLVHARFTNHQYHTLDKATGRYDVHRENSIFFELDGPYRAMILPSSKEEDKLLKKRYAVFEHDGSLAELKGFEVKRRGELQLIKDFQKQIFAKFLLGETLVECYAAVAKVADQWLDILYDKGSTLHDEELVDLIAENKSMSKMLSEYGSQKSTAITTAKRLAEFLGAQMVKDKGLACKFIISAKPYGAPVTERAVPVAIFNAEESVKQYYLRRFLRDNSITDFDLRSILDWDYYIERFGGVIQKLITIPAAMQKVPNPVPRIRHPDWLFKRVAAREDKFKQKTLADAFKNVKPIAAAVDMEDFGDRNAILKAKAAAATLQAAQEQAREPEPLPPIPNIDVDYRGWVAAMKPRWRAARLARAGGTAVTAPRRGMRGALMTSHLSRSAANMATATWDVVQIAPASRAGEYKLWISIAGQLQSVKLRIPRQFYLSLRKEPQPGMFEEGYIVEKVSKTLPRGMPCKHCYRLTVPEDLYREEETHFSSLLNHPIVEGVYELQVPLDVRALIKLGSTCSMDRRSQNKLSRALDSGFDLQDLVRTPHSPISKQTYLNAGAGIRYFYLYHAQHDGRHVLGLFSPEGQLRLHIIDSAGLRQVPNLASLYTDRVSSLKERGRLTKGAGVFDYPDSLDVDFKVHTSEQRAFRALARDLTTLRTAKQGSSMLAISSSKPQEYYELNIGSAVSEFPVISIPAARAEDQLPALGWQLYSARRMFGSYLRSSAMIRQWIEIAAYFDLPLCNLERDFAVLGADIDFARRLTSQDMVLWWSSTPAPDLGGREQDNNSAGQSIEEVENVEMSRPGCYSNVVFELAVKDLAINSVLQSGAVNDMEGSGSGSMSFDTASHNLDEYSKGTVQHSISFGDAVLTSQVFSTIKSMVKSWYVAKARGKSTYSSLLADNFWRWVSSNRSAMFEPAMQKFMHGLMRKTLLQLLGEFKRLGSSIVYASATRLFLLTNKPTAGSAAAYGRYLTSAVTSRDLFRHLNLEIVHFWEQLIWMDAANFGGVICPDPEAVVPSDAVHVEANWNLQKFLPPAVQTQFATVVGGFIWNLNEHKRKTMLLEASSERTPLKVIQQKYNEGDDADHVESKEADAEAEAEPPKEASDADKFMRELVKRRLTRKMLKLTSQIQEEHQAAMQEGDAEVLERWKFPDLPGRVALPAFLLRAQTPALEFVKAVTAVLNLSTVISEEVNVLRRNLLSMLGIGAFSKEAEWRPPCEPFRLPLVICTFCSHERTLDLCRDEDIVNAGAGAGDEGGAAAVWRCNECAQPYSKPAIEARIISIAQSYLTAFTLQDLRCAKCNGVRETDMQLQCACSGQWKLTVSRVDTVRRLKGLDSIAKYHGLAMLQDAVQSILAVV